MVKFIIDLNAFHDNVKKVLSYKKGSYMSVIKANAYGHGIIKITQELELYPQIIFLGVATPEEAIMVKPFTTKRVVILGYTPNDMLNDIVSDGIIPSIFSLSQAKLISQPSDVFLNVDTGFHRLGQAPTPEYRTEIDTIMKDSKAHVLGIFTHMKLRSEDSDLNQIKSFWSFVKDLPIEYKSISDSIAFLRYNTKENLYRIGAMMYGMTGKFDKTDLELTPIQTLVTKITRIENVQKDDTAFYRGRVRKGMKVATIRIGYADGLFRTMPISSYVTINKHKCPYIEVGMDQSLIDITGIKAQVDDQVIVYGKGGISIQQLADLCNTNKNNILTMVSSRVKRVYVKDGKVVE